MAEEDCTDADYLGAYSRFFTEFIARVNPYDQLPVPVSSYNVTDFELIGEIINITLQYINQTPCPPSLQAHLVHQVIQEILSMCQKQPEDYGYKAQEKTYTSLKLMQAITGKVNEICTRYLDNSRLALLPPPPSTPLPQVIAGGNKNCRRRMEDRYVVIHDLHTMFGIEDDSAANYYAVFDGHGGQDAAAYSATHLHQYLTASLYYPTNPERALREAFIATDTQFIEKSKTQKVCGGTTAVCTLLLNKKLYVAWVGDSSAMLIKRDSVVQLVNPHRLQRKDEVRRIQRMGGVVMESMGSMRVNGVLSVSRAIGDVRYKPFVTGEPEIKCVRLDGNEDFLVLATDGLTDYLNPSEVLTVLYHEIQRDPSGLKRAHRILLRWAKREGSKDNITLVVVLLTPASEIAARPPNAHPFRCMKTNDILENMNSKDKPLFLDMDDAHNAINSNILKQTMLSQETRDRDDGILAASNGKHENGDADYDYSDLGPETDVDAVDDVGVPVENLSYDFNKDDDSNHDKDSNLLDNLRIEQPVINAKRQLDVENNLREDKDKDDDDDDKDLDKYAASETVQEVPQRIRQRSSVVHPDAVYDLDENIEDNYAMGVSCMEKPWRGFDDFTSSSDANRPLQQALIPAADNVADSEDSEDEWNYYPNKEKDPVGEPQEAKTEGEIESPELPIEDNELKIQSEDIGEGIKCETPTEEQSQLIHIEISAKSGAVEPDQEEKLFAKEQEESKDMDFPLNPDAAEFVPVSPQFRGPRMNLTDDYPISGSPLKQVPQMDDIQVPSQSEFEEEVCQRPREVEPEEREYQNGVNSHPTDDADFMHDRPKVHGFGANLDDSEISSMKAEFGDESSTSFLTANDFHRTGVSTVDESFSSSERDYDIAKDPMAMSFTPSDFEAAFDKAVDLNAVHNLSNTDLDDKNGTIEEEGFTAQSPEPHPELTTLASPAAEQPTHTPAFPEESAELVNLSSQQEDSEATFIEHAGETKANVDFFNLQSESSQLEQQETARSDHSPLTENYSAEFESEKEAVSIDNEPVLTPSSIEIDETKPMDETSEDAVPLEACSRQEASVKEADTPASISPVPEAMETDVLAPAEDTEVSSNLLFALDADAPEFKPGHYNFSPTESNDVCKPSLAKTNDVCETSHIETSNICESSSVETSDVCKPTTTEISSVCESSSVQASDVCQSSLVESSNDFQSSLVETSNVDQSPLIEESNIDQSPFVETSNIHQSCLVDMNNEVCESSSMKSSNVCEPVSHNLVFGMQPPEEKAAESIPTQSVQDNLLDFAEEEEVCVKKVVEVESTPPPSPQNSEEKVSNLDDMIRTIESALKQKVDDVVESKDEASVEANVFEFKTHVTEEPQQAAVFNVSESMPELKLSGSDSKLLPKSEDTLVSSLDQQLQEKVPQKEELIAAREPEQPSAPAAEECKIQAETKVEEVSSAIKEPAVENATEVPGNKVAKAAAVTAVAAGVVAGAVIAQSKTKTKPTAAKPSKTTATKTAQKSTPTSPSKTVSSTTRTSTAASKKPTTTRTKDLDTAKKATVSSTASSKVSATKSAPKTTSATSVTKSATRPNTGVTAKVKTLSTTAKTTPSDKKPTANGDIKSLNKADTTTAKPPISKTTSALKTASAKTTTARMLTGTTTTTSTKTRPASAVAATKPTTTATRTSSSATTTSTLGSRPKSTLTAAKPMKSRVSTPKSSPIIDKQVKETANKQISMARSSTVTKTTRVSTANTTTTLAKRTSMTTKTTSTASPIKKLAVTSKISNRTSTPGKTTTQKEKVVQNGVSEKVEMNAIIDDVPKKDLSPVVTPNDNQLIMSSD